MSSGGDGGRGYIRSRTGCYSVIGLAERVLVLLLGGMGFLPGILFAETCFFRLWCKCVGGGR